MALLSGETELRYNLGHGKLFSLLINKIRTFTDYLGKTLNKNEEKTYSENSWNLSGQSVDL